MLVDDKLAKEKLIHEIDILGNVYAVAKITIMNLIRNTDLTDCQPQNISIADYMTDTQAEVPPSLGNSGTPMSDILMTKLCAEAMGYETLVSNDWPLTVWPQHSQAGFTYDPLEDDAQAMALVRRFNLNISSCAGQPWSVWPNALAETVHVNLNRAIVGCISRMQSDGTAPETLTVARQDEPEVVAAPDQGSVRNATDEQDAKRYQAKKEIDCLKFMNTTGYKQCKDTDSLLIAWNASYDAAIDSFIDHKDAIRALPDQKD